jgi:hypothetical protein
MNFKHILAKNIRGLMALNPSLNSHAKLAAKCRELYDLRKIGATTIGHLLDNKDTRQPQLDTIVAIARAFKVTPWMLLSPDFDPAHRTIADLPPADVLELARRLMENRSALDVLRDALSEAIPDHHLEKNGFTAPSAAPDLQQKPASYTAQRQLKIKLKR